MAKRSKRFETDLHKAEGHALTAVERARSGECREALHWLEAAQRELLRAAEDWPRGGLSRPLESSVSRLEESSDEVLERCKRRAAGRARRRRRY